jgi:hypothetical protein
MDTAENTYETHRHVGHLSVHRRAKSVRRRCDTHRTGWIRPACVQQCRLA